MDSLSLRTVTTSTLEVGPRPSPLAGENPATAAPAEAGPRLSNPGDLRGSSPQPANKAAGAGALTQMADAAKNARFETRPDRIVDLELSRTPGAREALAKLSAPDQKRFLDLAKSQVAPGTRAMAGDVKAMTGGGLMGGGMGLGAMLGGGMKPMDPKAPPPKMPSKEEMDQMVAQGRGTMARNELYGILAEGKMGQKDSQGGTLLGNLEKLSKQQAAPGLDGQAVFRETLSQIRNPDFLHQGDKGTCTVATLEHLNASREPAEYARLVGGLTSPQGEVKLRNGETLKRDEGLTTQDNSGRSSVSRVYQASMMEYANGALDYDNTKDGHYKVSSRGPQGQPARSPEMDHRGLYSQEWERALDAVLPTDVRPVDFQGDRAAAERDLKSSLSHTGAVPVALRWARDPKNLHASHALSVEKMDATHVYLRNPWGYGDNAGKDGPVRELAPGQMKNQLPAAPALPGGQQFQFPTGGHIKMTREEFFKNLQFYYVPEHGGAGR